jgi:hypothetical protein
VFLNTTNIMNRYIVKFIFFISLATIFGFLSQNVAASEYKNRLSILPFESPVGWTAPYNPGDLITDILKQSIDETDFFQLSPPPASSLPQPKKIKQLQKIEKPDIGQSGKTQLNHPTQFILKGRVLNFTPGSPPSRAQLILNIGDAIKQKAEVDIELQLINHHMGKMVDKRIFKNVSSAGTVPFALDAAQVDIDSDRFQKSSIGRALSELNQKVNAFLITTLHPLPLEGEIISVIPENQEVIINVGKIHGIDFGDFFNVYSVTLKYKDPFTQKDLGDKFMRRGVIRVKDVQEGFSIAAIIAGEGFEIGELAQSRKTNPIPLKRESPEINPPL